MKVIVSACLLGQNCKYNGKNNKNDRLIRWLSDNGHDVIPVCPEITGGLETPRVPCEIRDGRVINKEGRDVDFEFRRGAEICLKVVKCSGAQLAVLQPRSPSCGKGNIYDGTFSGVLKDGNGIFAELLMENGIKVVTSDDI